MKAEAPSLFRRIVVFSIGVHIFAVCVFVAWQAMHPESAKKAGASAPSGGGGASHSDDTAEAANPPAPTAPAPVKEYDVDTQRDISFDDEDKMIAPLKRKAQAIQKQTEKLSTEQKLKLLDNPILRQSDPDGLAKATDIALKSSGFKSVAALPAADVPLKLGEELKTLAITNMYRKNGKVYTVFRDSVGHTLESEGELESEMDEGLLGYLRLYDQARDNPALLSLLNATQRSLMSMAEDQEAAQKDAAKLSPAP